ncbi:MAG: DNA methylase [Deltaproteobacteria bacterium]|nr:DNA methylase [Deltaproteobacteria bacterium]
MIERDFDIAFIADLALREKQIQQNYRPVIAVHKWFARRPGSLFRGLLLSEFASSRPLREVFYHSNTLNGLKIADPFMGGGIPLIEANRVGCEVIGYDINPMSYWVVKQELEHIDISAYRKSAENLRKHIEKEIGHLYRTTCLMCGSQSAHVKYFLWNKIKMCTQCGEDIDLFPGYLVSQDRRHPKNVFLCSRCGNLTESENRKNPGDCSVCGDPLLVSGPAKRNRCLCPKCGHINTYPDSDAGPPRHRLFAIEYHCPTCKPHHRGRFFKKPDPTDLSLFNEADTRWRKSKPRFLPDDVIPEGDESSRLRRWGYKRYREMFNSRQLLGLELSCRIIDKEPDARIRNALATNLSDLLRYQNMLCRYDKMALKSLDIFSVHGFPVGLIQCESNLPGIQSGQNGVSVGSGGWSNIIEKYAKAKAYCHHPFEVRYKEKRKHIIPIAGEWIGETDGSGEQYQGRNIQLKCADATVHTLPPKSLDGVFTDPPYFGNVQYAELMDFCYVWLRKLVGGQEVAFKAASTRNANELTGNENMNRGIGDFTEGLSSVFRKMAKALKPGSPLVFTYHHNAITAYYPIAVAILDAGLTCSASLPCPAEMGASIHINGTGSSIIDTVFVNRQTGNIPRRWLPEDAEGLASLVGEDFEKLQQGNVRLTRGDIRCVIYGHLTRLAIWHLRKQWDEKLPATDKLAIVDHWIEAFGGLPAVEKYCDSRSKEVPTLRKIMVKEPACSYIEISASCYGG